MASEKKTICFFNSNRAWGGGEKWHLTTCKEFARRGHKTFLVTNVRSELAKKGIQERLDVFSFYVHNLSFLNPFKILTLVALFKSQRVDTIILNLPSDLKVAGIAAKIAGVNKIVYRRGMPHPLKGGWLNRLLFRKVLTHVVVNSEEIGRSLWLNNESWFPKEKLVLIYNGVDTSRLLNTDRKLYTKKGGELVLGNAGRLTEQKGQRYLIEMAELLKNEDISFKLLIAGEGELRDSLLESIRQKDLTEEVSLLGHVEDMPAFFSSLDLFVFSSLYEGSANTLIETLQHQVPTVAFDVSSNPELIEHEETGLLAEAFKVEDLTAQVLRLSRDEALREKVKRQGLDLLERKFDSRKNLDRLEELLG